MLDREQASAMLLAPPFRMESRGGQRQRSRCLGLILDWLQAQPGATWQERWTASGAEDSGDWRDLAAGWLTAAGRFLPSDRRSRGLGAGLLLLVCGDMIRPGAGWLLARSGLQLLTGEMARTRDPDGFAVLRQACDAGQVSPLTRDLSLRRIAAIMAAKGGLVSSITAGDCLELAAVVRSIEGKTRSTGMYFYQLLRTAGVLPPETPASVRMFTTRGQLTPAELIGQYGIECGPVRDLLADYLTERLIAADYSTLRAIAHILGKLFWRDLELHNPGISSLCLSPAATAGWKQQDHAQDAARHRRRPGGSPDRSGQRPVHRPGVLPRHHPVGRRRPGPVGPVGGALPGQGRGDPARERTVPAQGEDGSADP